MKSVNHAIFTSLLALTTACGEGDPEPAESESAPLVYDFESRFQEGASSVSHGGQAFRHLLIEDLELYIGGLNARIEFEADFDASTVEESLLSYYEFDSATLGTSEFLLTCDPAPLQSIYNDVAEGKDLQGKVAGQDDNGARDHKDWSTEFRGFEDTELAASGGDVTTPDGLLRAIFKTIAHNAQLQADGDDSRDGLLTHQTASGLDLNELAQKFLLGALAFSQGADDYLDEGLSSLNSEAEEGEAFSALEHSWDEAFGYFGAAHNYGAQSEEDILAGVPSDANGDGAIDLLSEYNFGASVNAVKRDAGSRSGTDFAAQSMSAFLEGRALIAAEGDIEKVQVLAQKAVSTWERVIAATCVHYVNETLADYSKMETEEYSFSDHAQHFSELKGFALAFQFNPRSPLTDPEFLALHDAIGDAPVLESASEKTRTAYVAALENARDSLQVAYEFEAQDVENW